MRGRLKNIVVPTDFSELSEAAAARACALAQLDGAAVHLIHAVRFPVMGTPYEVSVPIAVWEGIREGAEQRLEEIKDKLGKDLGVVVTAKVSESAEPVSAIAQVVADHDAELVVMGTHGHGGIKHAFLGSVAERALRILEVPVLAVKEDAARASEPIRRIVVATDFSVHADQAVEIAAGFAKRLTAAIDVVHALELRSEYIGYATAFGVELENKVRDEAARQLAPVQDRLQADGLKSTVQSRRGSPSVVITELAEEVGAQLIVMGTRGESGLSHLLLGSVAERTIRKAPCSVLAVKAPEEQDSR